MATRSTPVTSANFESGSHTRNNARKQEIIHTAARLFDSAGYPAISLREIAAEVGLQKSTLYHYFDSKAQILYAIHEEFISILAQRQEVRSRLSISPRQNLLEVMSDILELMVTHRGHVRTFFEHYRQLPPVERKIIREKRAQYQSLVEQSFRAAIERGEFRDVDVSLAALALFGMCNWAYQWYNPEREYSPREIAYIFWGILNEGLVASPE